METIQVKHYKESHGWIGYRFYDQKVLRGKNGRFMHYKNTFSLTNSQLKSLGLGLGIVYALVGIWALHVWGVI